MFGRKKEVSPAPDAEPRPYGVRIMQLSAEDRAVIAQHRFEEMEKHLKAAGCATMPVPAHLIINFATDEHTMVLTINKDDPRQISLLMGFQHADGDYEKARWACAEATKAQFAAKASAEPLGQGYQITISVGVYAEALHSFGDSLKAYVDEVASLYSSFVTLMVSEQPAA